MRSRRARSVTRPPAWLTPLVVLVLYHCVAIRGNSGEKSCEEGSGGEEKDWWLDNFTNRTNYTELCTGMIDINSSEPIYSYPENNTASNYSNCELVSEVSLVCSLLKLGLINEALIRFREW